MAVHPLRPAMHRSLGKPLPYQLANAAQDHPKVRPGASLNIQSCDQISYPVLAIVSNSYPRPKGRFLTCYSPVRHSIIESEDSIAFDLHVLGMPPAFILSQDQTLHNYMNCLIIILIISTIP